MFKKLSQVKKMNDLLISNPQKISVESPYTGSGERVKTLKNIRFDQFLEV